MNMTQLKLNTNMLSKVISVHEFVEQLLDKNFTLLASF